MKPKIAVVVPVYNAENFLKGCLDSILAQDFEDFVIVCVNDASQDNSKQILEDYAKKDSRIVVINHEQNRGAGASRNTALDYIKNNLPTAEYISMVDADDRIDANTFSKTYTEAKNSDADIVNFNFLPSTYWSYKTEANTDAKDYNGNCVETIFDYTEFYTFVLCWSKLYKKELLDDLRFSEQGFYEDGSFAYKVLPRASKMRIIPDTLYCYNIENPESTCGKVSEDKRLESIFRTMRETVSDWEELGIYDKYRDDYIRHILLYASLVCPNALTGDYLEELNTALDTDILEDIDRFDESTIEIIRKMTGSEMGRR